MRDDQRRAARRLAEEPEPALSKRRISANYDNTVVHLLFVDSSFGVVGASRSVSCQSRRVSCQGPGAMSSTRLTTQMTTVAQTSAQKP